MKIEDITVGMRVHDPISGYGTVVEVLKTRVHVQFGTLDRVVYDVPHLRFLSLSHRRGAK